MTFFDTLSTFRHINSLFVYKIHLFYKKIYHFGQKSLFLLQFTFPQNAFFPKTHSAQQIHFPQKFCSKIQSQEFILHKISLYLFILFLFQQFIFHSF